MKKLISILIIMIIDFCIINFSYASDSDVSSRLSNEIAKPGDIITLSIDIEKIEDGIAGLQGKISWNESELTYINSNVGNKFSTLNFNDDSKSNAFGSFSVYGNEYVKTGGTVFTVTFKVNSELKKEIPVTIGITQIKAEYQTAGTVNIKDKEIKLSIINETSNEDNTEEKPEVSDDEKEPNINTPEVTNTNNITDNTISNAGKLPAAGFKNLITIAILITVIALVIFKVKSKDIKY